MTCRDAKINNNPPKLLFRLQRPEAQKFLGLITAWTKLPHGASQGKILEMLGEFHVQKCCQKVVAEFRTMCWTLLLVGCADWALCVVW